MKFDDAKAFPHPVLRRHSSDYQGVEFEVTFDEPVRRQNSTAFTVCADFCLSDPDLLQLVDTGQAEYALLTTCSRTHYRALVSSAEPHVCVVTDDGDVIGDVEVTPFMVATCDVSSFSAEHWNDAYRVHPTYDIPAGAVLAADEPLECPIDTAEEAPVSSIFDLTSDERLSAGEWICDLSGDRVSVAVSAHDYGRFVTARERFREAPEGAYILNGVYLPCLLHTLHEADRLEDELGDRRWFRTVNARLTNLGCEPLGSADADRLQDAQRIFESPFGAFPFLHDED